MCVHEILIPYSTVYPWGYLLNYAEIADAYENIEATTKRLEMTALLVELLKNTPRDVIQSRLSNPGQDIPRLRKS